jgi:hypothetical protein
MGDRSGLPVPFRVGMAVHAVRTIARMASAATLVNLGFTTGRRA